MRIAYILSSLQNSGPIIVALELARQMVSHGHTVDVFYFSDITELDFPCPTYRINMTQRIKFCNYDIVHCHGLRPDLYVLIHKPVFKRIPICTTIHSYMFLDHSYKYGKRKAQITARLVMAATMRDDRIILLSKDMQEYYKGYLPARKLTYAYNTRSCNTDVDLEADEIDKINEFRDGKTLLCSVSGLNMRKGLHQVIRALPDLPEMRYCIVGDGPERANLENLAAKLGVADRVLFLGYKADGFRYLKYADIFVMPSYSEGFPLAMLEAVSMSKPVVSSNISVFDEIFPEGEIQTFPLDDIDKLKDALKEVEAHKDKYAQRAYRKYSECYTNECVYNRHIQIYEDLIATKNRSTCLPL